MAALASCSSDGASVDCRADASCVIIFDRMVATSVTVLGVETKLVGVDGTQVIVELAGERVSLWVDEPATEVAGLAVYVERVDNTEVEIRMARS